MSRYGILKVYFDAFSSKKRRGTTPANIYEQFCYADFIHFSFTGKERDEETGYGYFGARYMEHELMTMWLSVDPMADKYPSISPYNYCMWNPVRLVDPDGKFPWDVHVEIVRAALYNKGFDIKATNIILFGTGKYADWVLFPFSNVHLDNKSGFANIAKSYSSAISKAISHLSNGNYLRAGKNLHTIADFYSHSNYVDLYSQYATEKGLTMDPELIPTFTDMMNNADFIEFANAHGGLKTGSFNTFSWLYEKACKKMGHPIPPQEGSHTSINLDSDESLNGSQRFDNRQSNSPTKHQVARRLAEREIENVVNISIEQ